MIHSIQTLAMLLTVLCCLLMNVSSVPTCNFLSCFGSKADRILPDSFFDGLTNCGPLQNIRPFLKTNDFVKGYKIEKAIACGGFGVVVSATDLKKNRKVAIKISLFDKQHEEMTMREIHAVKALNEKLSSSFFLKFYEEKTVVGKFKAIVMELVVGVDLLDFAIINSRAFLSEFVIRKIFIDIFKAQFFGLKQLQNAGLCHNDIKPENIMIYRGPDGLPAIKFIDFGFTTNFTASLPAKTFGTEKHAAPELLTRKSYKDCHASDIFATGVSLFKIAYGNYPFANMEAIVGGKIALSPLRFHGSQLLVNILNEMMNHDSYKRITIDRILQHPWTLQAFPANSMTAAVTHLKYQK